MNRHTNMKPHAAQGIARAGSRSPRAFGGGSDVLN
jgi:hypothetical protein